MSVATDFVRLAPGEIVVKEAEIRRDKDPLYVIRVALAPLLWTVLLPARIALGLMIAMSPLAALGLQPFGLLGSGVPQMGWLVITNRRLIYYVRERGIVRDVHSVQDIRLDQVAGVVVGREEKLLAKNRWIQVFGEDHPAVVVVMQSRIIYDAFGRDLPWVERELSATLSRLTEREEVNAR